MAGLPEEMKRKLRSRQIAGRLEALHGEAVSYTHLTLPTIRLV